MEQLQNELHTLRKELDAIMNKVIALKENPVSLVAQRNMAICFTHLEDAKMRLGKALGDTGSELPAEFADKAAKPQDPAQPQAPVQPAQAENASQPAAPATAIPMNQVAQGPTQPVSDNPPGQQPFGSTPGAATSTQ